MHDIKEIRRKVKALKSSDPERIETKECHQQND
eukprot:UN07107